MIRNAKVGFVCFGEINTPMEAIVRKRDEAYSLLAAKGYSLVDAGIVTDDAEYRDADTAIEKLKGQEMDVVICCVAGWIPTHTVVRVMDTVRHLPIVLWGLCGWIENGHIVTTADQAGTTAIRPVFEEFDYQFKYVYSVMGEEAPIAQIDSFVNAARAKALLRQAHIGTMGYRDMLLYGTQFEGNSLRSKIGVEVEPFEMLEMVQNLDTLDQAEVTALVEDVKKKWSFQKECDDAIIERGVRYALAIGKKVKERNYEAISLLDVDGMKKLMGFPPAMVFMLLDRLYGVQTIPENDILGAVTQLMVGYITGTAVPYFELYEFFNDSVLIGVPDFIPEAATEGETLVLPTAFGLLSASLLNVSKVKTGKVTLSRLVYRKGRYLMQILSGEAKAPPSWEECGWAPPAPQLPSLEVTLSIPVPEFAQKVSSQHIIVSYGDQTQELKDLCYLLGIEII